MITEMWDPRFYSQSNFALLAAAQRDKEAIIEKWADEAAIHALSKDPTRSQYVEDWIRGMS